MLSILIPIYNYDVREFVLALKKQCDFLKIAYEIILIDDASEKEFQKLNGELVSHSNIIYQENENNQGRSIIRNSLAAKAEFQYLLFLDCDSFPNDDNFIERYIDAIKENPNALIYGGRNYESITPSNPEFILRWTYGVQREIISASERAKQPYQSFMTNNFLMKKEDYLKIKLDETILGYGHEDTLFGIELGKLHYPIIHIENPLTHLGLETSDEFIAKTIEGVKNLVDLVEKGKITKEVKLWRAFSFLRKMKLIKLISLIVMSKKEKILLQLKSNKPKLVFFNLLKLAYVNKFAAKH